MKRDFSCLHVCCPPAPAFISSGKQYFHPGESHVDRVFPAFVAMFVDEGMLYITEDDVQHSISAGHWFIQLPGKHYCGNIPCTSFTSYFWIHFMPLGTWNIEQIDSLPAEMQMGLHILDNGGGMRPPVYDMRIPLQHTYPIAEWQSIMHRLVTPHSWSFRNISSQGVLQELFEQMILESSHVLFPHGNPLARQVEKYLQDNIACNTTMKQLSEHFHFSPDYITRCVRKQFGISTMELLMNLRVARAKELLLNTSSNIQEISCQLGYENMAVFSRMFRTHTGMAPSEFRKKIWGRF